MSKRLSGPIRVRGRVYASARDCAAHLGVGVKTVRAARSRGTLDALGLGRGYRSSESVTVRGQVFASAKECAAHFGVDKSTVNRLRRTGRLDSLGAGGPVRAVTIRGETYPSMAAAARALGVSRAAISMAAARGGLDAVGMGQGHRGARHATFEAGAVRKKIEAPKAAAEKLEPPVPVPLPEPLPQPVAVVPFEQHPGVAARRALRAELAQRDGPDAWPEDWFDRRDPADAQRCRRLWCGVLVVSLREVLERYRKALRNLPARGRTAEMIERVWRHAGSWVGSRDFAEVCHLAGYDPAAVAERFAGLRRDPGAAEVLERALRSHPSRGDRDGEAA